MTVDAATVRPAAHLRGMLRLPGDKSISHRALLLAALANGESRIAGAGDGADVRSTAGIVAALGASVDRVPGDGPTVGYRVVSPGPDGLRPPVDAARLRELGDEPPPHGGRARRTAADRDARRR